METLRIGSNAEQISFSPRGQQLPLSMVYDFLFYRDDGEYHPRAAESFEYNDGNTLLTIKLRDDLAFSDGSPVDAESVKASILWSKDNGAFFSAIEEVVVKDDRTLEIHQSYADKNVMLSLWAMPLMTIETTEDPDAFATSPVESGPYIHVSEGTTAGSTYAFERNEDYWNAEEYPFEKATITLLPDDTSRLNALISGQIDAAPIATTTAAEAESSGFSINELKHSFGGLILGDRRGEIAEPISDVRVRQAINMAFDREAIAQSAYAGFATPSEQPFAEGMTGYQEDLEGIYEYDPDRARELLAAAGYPDGFDLLMPSHEPTSGDYEAFIRQYLGDIGINVTFDPQSTDTWLSAFSGGEYAVVPMGLPFDQTPDSADPEFFWNPWRNEDPHALELLRTMNAGTPEEAAAATDELGRIALEEAWFAIYAHPSTLWASVDTIDVQQPEYVDWVRVSDIQLAD